MGKTRDLFKKIRDTKGTFHATMGSIKGTHGPEQVEAWQTFEDQIPRQVEAGRPPGTPGLELGIPKVSSVTSAG